MLQYTIQVPFVLSQSKQCIIVQRWWIGPNTRKAKTYVRPTSSPRDCRAWLVRPPHRSSTTESSPLMRCVLLQRTRKRRVRDIWGNWCDAKDLEGHTYEVCYINTRVQLVMTFFFDSVCLCVHQHLSAEELARRREEMKKHPKPCKIYRFRGSVWTLPPSPHYWIPKSLDVRLSKCILPHSFRSVDPFQLIPCRSFGEEVQVGSTDKTHTDYTFLLFLSLK